MSDQIGFISEVGHSSGRRKGAPAECSVRKMAGLTVNADVLAGRSLAAYCYVLGDMRSIAPFPACLRRIQIAERNETEREQAGAGRVVTRRAVK